MACLAQTMEVFWQQGGRGRRLRRRPRPARHLVRPRPSSTPWTSSSATSASGPRSRRPTCRASSPPTASLRADDARLDRVAEAFAGIVDAKSPYTARHCAGVAEIADGIASHAWASTTPTRRLLRRAALLHDVGKLGVSNRILDKPGPLSDGEWSAVRRHPRLSMVILRAVPALADVARLSATHHERLDGSGYPYGLTASELKLPDRILQVADVDRRPDLRAPVPRGAARPTRSWRIMRYDAGKRLDAGAFAAVEAWLPSRPPAASPPSSERRHADR